MEGAEAEAEAEVEVEVEAEVGVGGNTKLLILLPFTASSFSRRTRLCHSSAARCSSATYCNTCLALTALLSLSLSPAPSTPLLLLPPPLPPLLCFLSLSTARECPLTPAPAPTTTARLTSLSACLSGSTGSECRAWRRDRWWRRVVARSACKVESRCDRNTPEARLCGAVVAVG
jgi:hypothetical protein